MTNDSPQKRNTLHEWEQHLAPQVRQVELLGEITITAEDGKQLGRFLGLTLRRHILSDAIRAIKRTYPAAFAVFLTAQGVYGYQEGSFWPGVGQALDKSLDANWSRELGQLFEEILESFGLPLFPDLGGRRYVDLILMHGGIPDYSLSERGGHNIRYVHQFF